MADKIKVTCECGKALTAPASYAGKDVKCPHCGRVQTLPPESVISLDSQKTPPPANDSLDMLAPPARRLPIERGYFICPNPKCDFVGNATEQKGNGADLFMTICLIIIVAAMILAPMIVQTMTIEKQRASAARELERAMAEAKRELEKISKETSANVNYGQTQRLSFDVAMAGYNLIVWSILVVGAAICLMLSVSGRKTEYKCPWCGMRR